jgi:hypothetical protein
MPIKEITMSEPKGKYAVKKDKADPRIESLTVRMSLDDLARLERLRKMLSPYAPLSQGKTISVVLGIAEKKLNL